MVTWSILIILEKEDNKYDISEPPLSMGQQPVGPGHHVGPRAMGERPRLKSYKPSVVLYLWVKRSLIVSLWAYVPTNICLVGSW